MENQQNEAIRYSGYQGEETEFFSPDKKKILIIKLGALGDVLRTTPVLLGIKKKYPDSFICWLTKESALPLLKNNPLIDKLFSYNWETILRLQQEKFDILFNFEIDTPSTIITNVIKAEQKFGYFFNEQGITSYFNPGAKKYLDIAFNDELKKANKESYQKLMFQAGELNYENENYILELPSQRYKTPLPFPKQNNIIGINLASGGRWESKLWDKKELTKLIEKLLSLKMKPLLLGGPEELELLPKLAQELTSLGLEVYYKNTSSSIEEFIHTINECDAIISTDSLGLHISLALKKPTIGLFFTTSASEVEEKPHLKRLQSPLYEKYFYTNEYSPEIGKSISADEVFQALKSLSSS